MFLTDETANDVHDIDVDVCFVVWSGWVLAANIHRHWWRAQLDLVL